MDESACKQLNDIIRREARILATKDELFNHVMNTVIDKFEGTSCEVVTDAVSMLAIRSIAAQDDIKELRGQIARLRVEFMAKEEK